MAKRKVIYVQFKEAPSIPAINVSADASWVDGKKDIVMYTGIENGFLTLFKGTVEAAVPLSNVKSLVWERVNDK